MSVRFYHLVAGLSPASFDVTVTCAPGVVGPRPERETFFRKSVY